MKGLIVFSLNFALLPANGIAIQAQSNTRPAKLGKTLDEGRQALSDRFDDQADHLCRRDDSGKGSTPSHQ